jgi:hypothetical protein
MLRRSLIGALAAAPLARPAFSGTAYTKLFDGRSLDGWDVLGDANWTVRDGVIAADKGGFSFLISKQSYRDFDLLSELWVSDDANSGIFIRCSDRRQVTATTAYEVNVYDTRPDPTYGTGAIVNVGKVSPMPRAGGKWNTLEISARGDRFSVAFNGRRTVDAAEDGSHPEGPIALQYGAGIVKFRRVEVRTP